MTTIAVRDGIMATDSQFTTDSGKTRCRKMFRVPEGILGLAGVSGPGLELLHWLRNHTCEEPVKTDEYARDGFDAILLTRKGVFYYEESLSPDRVTGRFFACGSGGAAALGAMHMGASAAEAVRVASKVDPSTGGPVRIMRV